MLRGQEWEYASRYAFPGASKCFCLWSSSGAPCGGPRSINHVVMPNCFTLRILDVLSYGRRGTSSYVICYVTFAEFFLKLV